MQLTQNYWVMRVMLHEGKKVQLSLAFMSPGALEATTALINTGELALMPDGSIAEPVEGYLEEHNAHAAREKLQAQYPAEDFRVVITMDVKR